MARSEKITFTGADGESRLAARLDLPAGPAKAYALFAHCFTCTQNVFAAARIADGLTRHGIAVLRFDFTGLGASEGDFANTNFSSNVGDLRAAAQWLRDNREAPKILIGHSLGGAAVLAAAGDIEECVAVATIGAPAEPAHVKHLLQSAEAEIETKGEAEVKIVGRPFRITKQFLDDIAEHRLADKIQGLKRALIVFHAPRDAIVGIDNASKIFLAAKHPKSFVSLDDADHLLSRREDAIYVASMIAAWAERYLPAVPEEVPVIHAPEGAVTVAEAGLGRYTQTVSVGGRHVLYADEPQSVGGDDLGPSPYDLLLAGLGACTAMTMRMYAEHKKLPLERAAVTLRHEKIHAEDCEHCDTTDGKVDRIAREITLEGPLDSAQRAKLLEIADKCPVHRTLHSEVWVDTKLKS
ncbi:MAG: alpha/beta fold hydrolase [Hyphomicrobiales bacterium]|nr:alpha/beta fold hydrolase [Hyphomicrobiales bacterium]